MTHLAPTPEAADRRHVALARYEAANAAAERCGHDSAEHLYAHVILRGYQRGDDRVAFDRAQGFLHHVVQPLQWSAEALYLGDVEDAARWERSAYRGALFLWLAGRA